MKCAVAIVLAIIGMAMAHPAPIGISLAHSVVPSAVVTSSVINHGVTLPRIVHVPITPIITPVYTSIIKTPIVKPLWGLGLGHGWH